MVSKMKISRKLPKDPRRPRQPPTSFGYFLRDNQAAALNSPMMRAYRQAMVLKVAGKMWRKSTPEERNQHIQTARQSTERYKRELGQYKPPTAEQWRHIGSNWPKRSRVNYNFFVMDVFGGIWRTNDGAGTHGVRFGAVSRMVAERWRRLSEEEKEPYNERYATDRQRYQREVKALWASVA